MKKVLIILVALALLIAAFLLIQRCEPREKSPEDEEATATTEESEETSEEFDERSAFINANIEFTCKVIKDQALAENEETAKEELNKSYQKFGLPVDNDEVMIEILDKYENDTEVINIIKENSKACQ